MKNYILFLILLSLFSACNTEKKVSESISEPVSSENEIVLTEKQAQIAKIQTSILQKGIVNSNLLINGTIDVPPQNLISISTPIGAYLKNTKLLPGIHINKGEVIATIEDQALIELQQNYLLIKSRLHYSELEFKRQKDLNEAQAGSSKSAEQAESELKNNKIMLAGLSQKLELLNVNTKTLSENNISKSINLYSPINGFVSKVNVNIGKYVMPSDILFELVNPTDIHLNIKVYEKDIASLAIGKKVIAFTNANPEKKYECEIILISKIVSADGTVEVHCHFETYDKTLIPGMYMNAEIEVSSSPVDTLPEASVVNFDGKNYVFIDLGSNKYQMAEVSTGAETNGAIEIKNIDQLKDKKIVTSGAYTLLMSLKNVEE